MKSRSVKQNCPPDCDGNGIIRGDNGGDGSELYPLREELRDCPVCAGRVAAPRIDAALQADDARAGEDGRG
jgi:hypothetical protein